ncbi:CBS domain-containing protein [Candidatus Desantisbacteria bacterium]|nr:CBS domain-containing protein [Candidatus Desantisbacteria bacterium]
MTKAYEVSSDKFIKVKKDESIYECGKIMGNSAKKYVAVVDGGKVLGIVLGLNIIKKLVSGEIFPTSKAIDFMTPLTKVNKDDCLEEILNIMIKDKTSQVETDNKIIDKDTLLEYIYLNN